MIDPAVISAGAALAGSAVGAVASFATTWSTQRHQHARETHLRRHAMREALYIAFIDEATARYAEAMVSHPTSLDGLAKLYSLVAKLRLCAADAVVTAAEQACDEIIAASFAPNRSLETLAEARTALPDPLEAFSRACRDDLQQH